MPRHASKAGAAKLALLLAQQQRVNHNSVCLP